MNAVGAGGVLASVPGASLAMMSMLVVLPTPRRRLGGALDCGGRVEGIAAACARVVGPCGVGRVGVAIALERGGARLLCCAGSSR